LRELSKFRDFTENRSVLFPSALATIAEASSRGGQQLDFQSQKGIFIVCISNPSPGSVLFNTFSQVLATISHEQKCIVDL